MVSRQSKYLFILLVIFLGTGCGKSSNDQTQQSGSRDSTLKAVQDLEAETMAVHDSIMPEMDSLISLKKQLEQQLKTTSNSKPKRIVKKQVDSLKAAKEKMMSWMSRYTKGYKRMPDSVSIDRKAVKLDSLHNDIRALKQYWDQTLKRSSELVKEMSTSEDQKK
jgi:hypothetical protein